MDNRDLDIDVTDTESSASESSSSVEEALFKTHLPFVLELHDIRKDDPLTPGFGGPVEPTAVPKIRKHKKKKKGPGVPGVQDTSHTSLSDSLSNTSSVAPSATDVKEEFYDAHESYHAIPENQIPIALAATVVGEMEADLTPTEPELSALSEPQSTKEPELSTSSKPQTTTPAKQSEPSPIIKPTSPP